MKPKVYLETTIPSFLTAWPSRDVLIAGQQQATRDWWNERRTKYQLFVSVLVTAEAGRGDSSAVAARMEKLKECLILPYPEEAQDLTRALVESRLIPVKAETDAAHIAIAAVHGMEFLLTWNCRHIANAAIVEKVRGVCEREGFPPPVIADGIYAILITMKHELLEEVWRIRDEIGAECGHEVEKLAAMLRREEDKHRDRIVHLPIRRVRPEAAAALREEPVPYGRGRRRKK